MKEFLLNNKILLILFFLLFGGIGILYYSLVSNKIVLNLISVIIIISLLWGFMLVILDIWRFSFKTKTNMLIGLIFLAALLISSLSKLFYLKYPEFLNYINIINSISTGIMSAIVVLVGLTLLNFLTLKFRIFATIFAFSVNVVYSQLIK
jgi:hypothetical protein